jgi:hypothetical protein
MLTDKSLRALKERDAHYLWDYAASLFRIQGVLLEMEKTEKDPDVLKDIATRAISLADELDSILAIIEDALDE